MLVIRMQRVGRKGHAMFRVVVQDARRTPTSGKVVAYVGSYDPHAKTVKLDKEKLTYYLEHGAQPSPRVVSILKAEKVKLPNWVAEPKAKSGNIRNPQKRRSTTPPEPQQPKEDKAPVKEPEEAEVEAASAETGQNEDQSTTEAETTEA